MTGRQDLKDLLAYATAHEPPPVAGPAAVFGRARSMRRRRRVAAGLAGVAAVGALVAGVSLAGQVGAEPRRTVLPAAPAGTPAATVLQTLRALLPPELRVSGEEEDAGFARVVLTDAAGQSTVEVNVQPGFAADAGKAAPGSLLDRYDCVKRADPEGTSCTDAVLADRTRVVLLDGPEEGGVIRRQVDILSSEDVRVVVTAWNAVDVREGPPTRPAPALDGDQLRAIAISDRWRAGPASRPAGPGR